MKPNVIVDPNFRRMEEVFSPVYRERLNTLVNIIWGQDEPMPHDAFMQALPDAEVVVCADWRYGDVLQKATKLRAIFTISGAFPLDLDYAYCFENGIRVVSAAPSFARQVAEMSLALALSASREIVSGDRAMRHGNELYLQAGNASTFMLYDQPVGIIGYGSIARALHPLLMPFNVKISVYDPWLGDGYLRRFDVEPVTLESLMRESRVVFVLAAPTSENQAMLNRSYLEMLPHGAVLVLASRAHVVDFDAMTEMVVAGRFKVATDVFPTEPLAPNHPIRTAENAVLSAHRAGSVKEGLWEIGEMVVDDLEAVLAGLPPRLLQNAEPEFVRRYAVNRAKTPDETKNNQ
ncbi:MAG: hydroxyacid dehydrogenase [Aggregatilineales bacterium]